MSATKTTIASTPPCIQIPLIQNQENKMKLSSKRLAIGEAARAVLIYHHHVLRTEKGKTSRSFYNFDDF